MKYNLNKLEITLIRRFRKGIVKKQLGKSIYSPLTLLAINVINKKINVKKFTKYKEVSRYISSEFIGFNVGKYSYGYEQFWGTQNNARLLENIGSFTAIAEYVTIAAGNHPYSELSQSGITYDTSFGFVDSTARKIDNNDKVNIGSDVWIGCNVTILPGVSIGDGAVVGAGSIVTKNVEPYSIVVGSPAKHIKYRFSSSEIKQLIDIKWWGWDDDKIKQNIHLLSQTSLDNLPINSRP